MQKAHGQYNCVYLQIMLQLSSVIMSSLASDDYHVLRCSLLISVKFSFHKRSRTARRAEGLVLSALKQPDPK